MPNQLLLPAKANNQVRLFSFGGGVQSTAVMVLQAQRKIVPYDCFVFANVGDDSENPATLDYVETHAKPFAAAHGIPFVEVQKVRRGGEQDTLVQFIERTERSIPARMSNGAPGNRTCTSEFKIKVVDKWVKDAGYSHAVIGLGISIDEFSRVRGENWEAVYRKPKDKELRELWINTLRRWTGLPVDLLPLNIKIDFWKRREHPLIDLRISRHKCVDIIQHSGLPVPPKSSCFFCPFTRRAEWIEMKRETPELFEEAVRIEHIINAKRGLLEKDRVYLHADVVPLENAVGNQMRLFTDEEMDVCESGYCLT